MRASGQGELLEMVQMNHKLLAEATRIKAGITDPKEAWAHLDERYSDKKLVVVCTGSPP